MSEFSIREAAFAGYGLVKDKPGMLVSNVRRSRAGARGSRAEACPCTSCSRGRAGTIVALGQVRSSGESPAARSPT